jgi:hypothetical protein
MLSRLAVAALCAVTITTAWAAEALPLEEQLPRWARSKWEAVSKARALKLSSRINPFVWRGDFDGDGQHDLAARVQHVPTGKEGIVILLRGKLEPVVVGAGRQFGNGGDDFAWMDTWSVEDRGAVHRMSRDKAVRVASDALLVAKEGSASALIYLVNGRPRWQQQGD